MIALWSERVCAGMLTTMCLHMSVVGGAGGGCQGSFFITFTYSFETRSLR